MVAIQLRQKRPPESTVTPAESAGPFHHHADGLVQRAVLGPIAKHDDS